MSKSAKLDSIGGLARGLAQIKLEKVELLTKIKQAEDSAEMMEKENKEEQRRFLKLISTYLLKGAY